MSLCYHRIRSHSLYIFAYLCISCATAVSAGKQVSAPWAAQRSLLKAGKHTALGSAVDTWAHDDLTPEARAEAERQVRGCLDMSVWFHVFHEVALVT